MAPQGGSAAANQPAAGQILAPPQQAVPAKPAAPALPAPAVLLDASAAQMLHRRSISVQLRQQVELLGHRMVGSGTYIEQQAPAARMSRLELRIQLGEQTTSLVQVCDGQSLWTHRRLFDDGKLERVDLHRVHAALRQAGRSEEEVALVNYQRLCGLGKLLGGFRQSFQFDAPQPGIWGTEELPVWRLVGRWSPQRLAELLPGHAAALAENQEIDPADLPAQMPDQVVLLLGQADLFPYRIEYRRTQGSRGRFQVTMDLYDPVFDAPIAPRRFAYARGNTAEIDATPGVLRSLGLPAQ